MKNLDVRLKIKDCRLCHYEVAQQMGISEYTLCIWLRNELTDEKKNRILAAIDELKAKM